MLSESERKHVEARLLEDRERALAALEDFDQMRESTLQDGTGDLTLYRFHPADIGTEAMEREKQFLLASSEGRRLYEIDEALRRLYRDPESFGTCERCGARIAMERLEVVPATTFCAACQRDTES